MSENKKEDFPVVVSQWNSNIEKNIKEIGDSCKGYKWMHITATQKAMKRYNTLMYLTIVLGPITGLLGTISAAKNECSNSTSALQVMIITFSFISGVMASIVKYSKYNEKSVEHKTTAAKYTSLEGNIRRQLSLYRNDRVNPGKYLQWVSVSFDELFSSSPIIPDDVYKEWLTFAKSNNLYMPKEYNKDINIEKHQISALAEVGDIKINGDESSPDLIKTNTGLREDIENNTKPDHVVDIYQTKRTATYTTVPELNRFTDPRMKYEIGRMFGLD